MTITTGTTISGGIFIDVRINVGSDLIDSNAGFDNHDWINSKHGKLLPLNDFDHLLYLGQIIDFNNCILMQFRL